MSGLVVLLAVACVALVAHSVRLRRRVDDLEWRLEVVNTTANDLEPGPPVIVIEMRNIGEVAMQRTAMAWPLVTFAPGVLRTIVLRQTVRQMRTQMAAEGVDAEVVLRRLPSPAVAPNGVEPTEP